MTFAALLLGIIALLVQSVMHDRETTKRQLRSLEHSREQDAEKRALIEALLRQEGKAIPNWGGKRELKHSPGYWDVKKTVEAKAE